MNDSARAHEQGDRKSTRLNSSHANISYAVFCLKKKNKHQGGHDHIHLRANFGQFSFDIFVGVPFFVVGAVDLYDSFVSFFFNDTATTEIYTLSLHDALPISRGRTPRRHRARVRRRWRPSRACGPRSEEHTSELQSRQYLVCRLLLEKKK